MVVGFWSGMCCVAWEPEVAVWSLVQYLQHHTGIFKRTAARQTWRNAEKRWYRPCGIIYKATWGRVCVPFTPSARHGALLLLPFGPAHADNVGHLESPKLLRRLSLLGDARCRHGRASDDGLVLT